MVYIAQTVIKKANGRKGWDNDKNRCVGKRKTWSRHYRFNRKREDRSIPVIHK